jgi:carbon monoxide dehydrogenase subunit G
VQLEHEFTVPASLDEVWKAVVDPERVAPCMPGATLKEVEGDSFKGTVKVKLGPISLLYKGSGEFLEKDEAAHKVVIKASGKDARGAGTAAATVTVTLTGNGDSTHGSVSTDLQVTGKPAQFGRGMISEVGGKILDTFATSLADRLGSPEPAASGGSGSSGSSGSSAGTTEPAPAEEPESDRPKLTTVKPAPETEALDLMDFAGASVAKRLAPVIAGVAVLVAVIAIIRKLRG